ncbi:hypothetical protein DC897_RS22430 [Vibrio parahaemolyticus]|uniref:hypothetical protein n=1 Tax=Vibrio parahaemolyticus TaxID=670 RepID=UPI000812E919|nr:hypothetical protein [Vibrio parahaemolyticus]EGQ8312381.1 hypothetical protein [Vibrio parahaemolyticus]EGQ8852926.1 hypothetical protein [Vibrio parahaemolyticus]EGQ8857575.1 hypothetical protein [Vibrio parahaemolyticus]EGQ8877008.1 hypothetical protein [Vibrio parahaemolyticus]EGQ8996207.1 hypothetical protein [Vibrio parahaemolyticus]
MSQFKRRYVRLEEACDKTYLTKWDILEAIEEDKLCLFAQISATSLGAIHPPSQSVAAIFDYKGLVQLTNPTSKQFALSSEPVPVQHVIVVELHCINRWRSVTDVFDNVLQASFKFSPNALTQPNKPFLAYMAINASLTTESMVGEFITKASKVLPNEAMHQVAKQYPSQRGQRLSTDAMTVKPTQIRVDMEEVVRVFGEAALLNGGCQAVSTVETTLNSTVGHTANQYLGTVNEPTDIRLNSVTQPMPIHPIAQIAYRVLKLNPQARSDKVWNMIRQDVRENEFNRQFDVDALVDSITQDSVTWFGRGDNENTMSYDSFRKNILVDIRRQIKVQK